MRYGAFPLLFPLFALAACGSPASRDATGATSSSVIAVTSGATLTFAANWTQATSAPLVAGQVVTVAYDPARLPTCRGDLPTEPGWNIAAFFSLNGGPANSISVAGQGLLNTNGSTTFQLPAAGDLAMWFQVTSVWGCTAYDSNYGANYHFAVAATPPNPSAPGWIGNASTLVDRATCGDSGGPCYADAQSADLGFTYDTWARERASIAEVFFDVWKQGVTDFDNPNLWKQLDVEMHSRIGASGPFAMSYVSFAEREGNNARYAVNFRPLDPLPGQDGGTLTDKSQCPTFPTTVSADGQYIQADFELYFTVNGVELRPSDGTVFHGLVQNYLGLYAICSSGS